jgi:hypothetical protein
MAVFFLDVSLDRHEDRHKDIFMQENSSERTALGEAMLREPKAFQAGTEGVGHTGAGLTRDLRPPPFPFAKLARCSQRPFSELNFEHRICPIEGEVRAGIVRELVVDRTEWYRARAAECEAMAFCTPDPHARALFEEMAATWRKLAERVEKWQLQ